MKAIYACKLYKTSTRKAKIKAALTNPLNAELVTQLSSYLDEEYKQLNDQTLAKDIDPDNSLDHDNNNDKDRSPASNSGGGTPSSLRPSLSDTFDNLFDDSEGDSLGGLDDNPDMGADLDDLPEDTVDDNLDNLDELDESTEINNATEVDTLSTDKIKSLLSDNIVTSGVNRILIKNNELWIYYNDDINLNTVMGTAVEVLNDAGYDSLDFNRLARSDNAIVFQTNDASDDYNQEGVDIE